MNTLQREKAFERLRQMTLQNLFEHLASPTTQCPELSLNDSHGYTRYGLSDELTLCGIEIEKRVEKDFLENLEDQGLPLSEFNVRVHAVDTRGGGLWCLDVTGTCQGCLFEQSFPLDCGHPDYWYRYSEIKTLFCRVFCDLFLVAKSQILLLEKVERDLAEKEDQNSEKRKVEYRKLTEEF